jgi:uncharacterized zinc-type alcohol dehydrogenase-like protein
MPKSATTSCFAAFSADTPLRPTHITRRDPGPTDVAIEILFCGVCHSDLHTARSEWGSCTYPCVPGHEIVGRVTVVGSAVTKFKPGDIAAVGCMVDSCRECDSCREGLEQYCERKTIWTYGSPDSHTDGVTYGGYSAAIVVDQAFTLQVPAALDLAGAAPLLCAGITTYSPLRHWQVGPGRRVGVVGLGGLGHMGVKLAHAMGAEVTLFTTSPGKADDARRLGADHVVLSTDSGAMKAQQNRLDFILNTVAVSHDLSAYLKLLRRDGVMTLVGLPQFDHPPLKAGVLTAKRRSLAGSGIGGIPETQAMLDFCAEHGIVSDVEVIPIQEINVAWERMLKRDVKYRFVIDMASLTR